ncbi:MAG: S8 family serine peptidase [Saprospiraceae bacterium]
MKPVLLNSVLILCVSILTLNRSVSQSKNLTEKLVLQADKSIPLSIYASEELVYNRYYRILSFSKLLNAQEKVQLQQSGIFILEYLDQYNYLASIQQLHHNKDFETPLLKGCFQIESRHKLSTQLFYGEPCIVHNNKFQLVIKYFSDISETSIHQLMASSGLNSDRIYAYNQVIYLSIPENQLASLTSLPWIVFIDCESAPGEPEDRDGRALHRVNTLVNNKVENIHLTGQGVKVMVRDDGSVGPHIDFTGRIQQDIALEIGDHGDGVSGIFAGAGNQDPIVEGMAPGAELYVINYQPDFLDKTLSFHQNEGVMITNSSYSNGCNAGYTIETQVVDKMSFENLNLLHVFSAGNSNGADCGYGAGNQWGNVTGGHKIGKNVLTVANLRLDGTLEESSSRGPAKDGRMKPEISARGTNELSTAPGNGTLVFGGTSAAAPGVAGVCALLYEAYKKKFNQNPESALIKAAVMNTATDIGTPGPDYQFGCGVIDGYRAYKLIQDERFQKLTINQGDLKEFSIQIPDGLPIAKFMIYWPEMESALMARKALINDLDFEIVDPNGTILLPWVLDPSPNASTLAGGASRGIDTLNNFEQITINFPAAGVYSVRIKGKYLPSNSVNCYFLTEMEDKILRLNFPIGGEQFNITEVSQIHYTAYGQEPIQFNFSTDAGKTWTDLGTSVAGSRVRNFYIPNNLSSDSCLIEISQGTQTVRSGFFTITNGVQGFRVSKYCPTEMELSWNGIEKDSVLIYKLGEKYMEPLFKTTNSSILLPNDDPRKVKWFSIAGYKNTALSRRELAIPTPDTLIGCSINQDLALHNAAQNGTSFYSCKDLSLQPVFDVINRTATPLSGFKIKAISSSGIVEQDYTETVPAYDTIQVTFSQGLVISDFGVKELKAWIEFNGDQNYFNDTISVPIEIQSLLDINGTYPMLESFTGTAIPNTWIQKNGLPASDWSLADVKGKNNQTSKALFFANQNPNFRTLPITIVSGTANLATAIEPYLYFDLAVHHFTNNVYQDSIQFKIKAVCGNKQFEKIILSGILPELTTAESTVNQNWLPSDTSWFWMAYDLSEFKGYKVVVEVEIKRGQGDRIFIDNVEIRERISGTGQARMEINPKPGCYNRIITFKDSSDFIGDTYYWNFGLGGNPVLTNGKGPVTTRYTLNGNKRINLKIKSSLANDAIVIEDLSLVNQVTNSYTYKIISGRTVQFTNNSVNADSYLWEFGDGTTSTEKSPIHVFDSAKIYRIKLTATNVCGASNRSIFLDLTLTGTSSTDEIETYLYPNPTKNEFHVISGKEIQAVSILNLEGKEIYSFKNVNRKNCLISAGQLPSGIYTLKITFKNGVEIHRFEKI